MTSDILFSDLLEACHVGWNDRADCEPHVEYVRMNLSFWQSLAAGINLLAGGIAVVLGLGMFGILIMNDGGGRGMALVVIGGLAILGVMTLPVFLHGLFYFWWPVPFGMFARLLTFLTLLELVGIYIYTQGFYDLFYSNEPYQLQEGICFVLMLAYFAVQFPLFWNRR